MADNATLQPHKESWLRKILHIPPDQSLIWWMIGKQKNWPTQIFDFIGFFIIFWFVSGGHWGAIAIMLGMFLHELGHYLVFVKNDIKVLIMFLFPLGAVAAPINKEENKRSDQLPWNNIGWLLLAGPTVNVLLMAVGLFLVRINFLPLLGINIISINGILALLNLLPISKITDGGQFFHVIFSSFKKKHNITIAICAIVVSLLVVGGIYIVGLTNIYGILYALFQNVFLFLFLIVLIIGILIKLGKTDPLLSQSSQAMTNKQAIYQLVFYACLIALCFIFFSL